MTSSSTLALSALSVGIAITGLIVALRACSKNKEKLALFFILLSFIGISSLPITLEFASFLYQFHLAALLPILLALPPSVYLYTLVKTSKSSKLSFHWGNTILPCTGLAVMFGYWLLPSKSRALMFLYGELPDGFTPSALALLTFALLMVWVITSIIYLIATIKCLRQYRRKLKNHFSNIENIELRWIDWFIFFLSTLWITSATLLIVENLGLNLSLSTNYLYVFISAVLLFLIAFISSPNISPDIKTIKQLDFQENSKESTPHKKYSKSSLSIEQARDIAERLENAMKNQQLYLDANLSLDKLSHQVGALPNFVSQSLNDVLGFTFYDYVGSWRIKASKKLLHSSDLSITNIYLEVGFNSRSTFYKLFKKHTGLTPKEYRLQNNQ